MKSIFKATNILLPHKGVDMAFWPSLACDQFTSQIDYWQSAEKLCDGKKSTLHITLPEVYLESENVDERINKICDNMREYEKDVLTTNIDGFVYTKRFFSGKSEPLCGIVGAVDLEAYSYEKGALPAVRPSENTVVSRIPPRLKVRSGASLETPHILMLIDDSERTIVEPLEKKKGELECLYNTQLMLDGGSAEGYAVTNKNDIERIERAIDNIGSAEVFDKKYPAAKGKTPLAMAVGDGNHSLATAKAHWEQVKQGLTTAEIESHPARYCLIELVNVHSAAIEIEPIHRVIFNADVNNFKLAFKKWLSNNGAGCNFCAYENSQNSKTEDENGSENSQHIKIVSGAKIENVIITNSSHPLAVGTVESFLDEYCAENENSNMYVDYIHGDDVVCELTKSGNVGVILPDFEKSDIFKGVVLGGVLPRKTFSMGTAKEKRYYLECRKIIK